MYTKVIGIMNVFDCSFIIVIIIIIIIIIIVHLC